MRAISRVLNTRCATNLPSNFNSGDHAVRIDMDKTLPRPVASQVLAAAGQWLEEALAASENRSAEEK